MKIVNTVLLSLISITITIVLAWSVRMDKKMQSLMTNQVSIQQQIIGHNLEADVWKRRIENLENAIDEHQVEQKQEIERLREWIDRTYARK